MDEENRNDKSSAEDDEIDIKLATEVAREAGAELFRSWGGVELEGGGFHLEESLTDEQWERRIEEGLKEMNVRVNEIYRRKKQEKESPD